MVLGTPTPSLQRKLRLLSLTVSVRSLRIWRANKESTCKKHLSIPLSHSTTSSTSITLCHTGGINIKERDPSLQPNPLLLIPFYLSQLHDPQQAVHLHTIASSLMSKALLSLIKPLVPEKSISRFTPHTKKLINETIQILKYHSHYEDSLERLFDDCETPVSEVAHLLLDKISDPEVGLKFFEWASKQPTQLNGFAYSSLLKLLAKSGVFCEIDVLLESMKCKDITPSLEALSAAVHAYANSGFVDKAIELYNFVNDVYSSVPDVLACNSLLNALVKCKKVDMARKIYDKMVMSDGEVDNYSTGIMLRALCNEGKVEEGRKLVEERWGEGCLPNVVFYNTLIDGYCKIVDVERANRIFREMKFKGILPTLETYGAIINGYCKEGNFKAIDRLLKEMRGRGLVVNVRILNNIIDARFKHGFKVEAAENLAWVVDCGCEHDIVTYNTLISRQCQDGKAEEACQLLEQAMQRGLKPNKFSYTPLIHVYCKQGEYLRASDLLIEMAKGGHKPDLVTFGSLVHGLVSAGQVDIALTIRDKMLEKGLMPDAAIYNVLISGLCKKGRFPYAKQLISEMLDQNIIPDAFVCATIVDGFIRNGNFDEAKRLFETTFETGLDPGVVGYNAMIKGYCKFGMMKDALSFVRRMMKGHHIPDEVTFSTLIDGYVKQNDFSGALRIFSWMIKRKCKPNVVSYTTLINGFCRNRDHSKAEKTFNEMQSCGVEPNVVTYTILIGSFCKEGKLAKAASFFELMLVKKCIPNDVTFNYLVNGFTNTAPSAILEEQSVSQESKRSTFLEFYGKLIADGRSRRAAAYSSILVCLCQHMMVKTALQLNDKMVSKGFLPDPVSFASLLYGLCLEGRLKEWKDIISCHLNESEIHIAIRYTQILNLYFPQRMNSEILIILESLVESSKAHNHVDDQRILQ